MPRAATFAAMEVHGVIGCRSAGCASNGSIRDARTTRSRRRVGGESTTESVRLARRSSRSALTDEWCDAEVAARFRSGIHACLTCRVPSIPFPHGQDGDRSQRRHRYNLYITASLSCRGRAVNGRESAPDAGQRSGFRFGRAKMMHYPREMTRRRVTPTRNAGDRGLTEAWGRLEMRRYRDSGSGSVHLILVKQDIFTARGLRCEDDNP